MQEELYKLTARDIPDFLKVRSCWTNLFGIELSKTQTYYWLERYRPDMVLRAFHVTQSWARNRRPSTVKEIDAINYTSGVLKNMKRIEKQVSELQRKADALLGGVL